MQTKRYLENLIHLCSDQVFGQEAVEWAVLSGHLTLTYDLDRDLRTIMGEACHPDVVGRASPRAGSSVASPHPGCYDALCAAYRAECRQNEALLVSVYQQTGFLDAIQTQAQAA